MWDSNTNVSGLCSRQKIVNSKRKLILDNVFVGDNGLKLEGRCSAFIVVSMLRSSSITFLGVKYWGRMKIRGWRWSSFLHTDGDFETTDWKFFLSLQRDWSSLDNFLTWKRFRTITTINLKRMIGLHRRKRNREPKTIQEIPKHPSSSTWGRVRHLQWHLLRR